jgi:nucleoside-diphosphate-sugar epimerase
VLRGTTIVVTGVTGQVAEPIAVALARDNEVWGAARFKDADARRRLEEAGVRCAEVDLVAGDLAALPGEVDYVLHFGVVKTNNWDKALAGNGEATGLLMARYPQARGFLHCSSTGVYQPDGHHRFRETDPLGDNHRSLMPTYSISKIAGEVVARFCARQFGVPTTIARLNVPYGDGRGWPAFHLELILAGQPITVHPDGPSLYNPIHVDDMVEQVPRLLEIAAVPAVTVHWAGPDTVGIEEWCAYLGQLVDREPVFEHSGQALESVATDTTRMHELIGPATVGWRDGMRRMVDSRMSRS